METLIADLRYATRKLARAPGFTFVALLTLALGIGANSAIFSVVYGVLFRPLPFTEPDRLLQLNSIVNGSEFSAYSPENYRDVAQLTDVFEAVSVHQHQGRTLTDNGEPEELTAVAVSEGWFDVTGVRPQLGRAFRPEDNQPGTQRVVIISNALWQQRFGGDPGIIERAVTLDREPHTVVGVMPAGFTYPNERDLWLPLQYTPQFMSPESRGGFFLTGLARLRDGVELERSNAAVAALAQRVNDDPANELPMELGLKNVALREAIVGDVRTPLLVLLAAVGFVLLIACANVASLLLARASVRESELAVRAALGAGRNRLVRQLVTESVLLGVLGGVLGLLLALWGSAALVRLQPGDLPRLTEVRVDTAVVAFTFVVAVLAGALFGLLPALQAARIDPYNALREGGRSGLSSRRSQRVRSALVVSEIALAVLLLAGAGLLIRSFAALVDVDPGFNPERVATFDVALPAGAYPETERLVAFHHTLNERLAALPGVTAVGAVNVLPLSPNTMRIGFAIAGEPPPERGVEQALDVRLVTPDYFRTMGIELRRGRGIEATDVAGGLIVGVLNEAAVRRYFPNGDPLGRTIELGLGAEGREETLANVVGVVGDVKLQTLGEETRPTIYLAYDQTPFRLMNVALRTTGEPLALVPRLRDELAALDANIALGEVQEMEAIVAESVSQPRFYMMLLLLFAAVAMTLAAVGIFGVMSFVVAQRRREIGIRMALGAPQTNVLRMVVGQALGLTGFGILIGVLAATLLTRVLQSLLYGISTTDPLAFLGAIVVLVAAALLASWLPARRAAGLDPLQALRVD